MCGSGGMADTLSWGGSGCIPVEVRVLSTASNKSADSSRSLRFLFYEYRRRSRAEAWITSWSATCAYEGYSWRMQSGQISWVIREWSSSPGAGLCQPLGDCTRSQLAQTEVHSRTFVFSKPGTRWSKDFGFFMAHLPVPAASVFRDSSSLKSEGSDESESPSRIETCLRCFAAFRLPLIRLDRREGGIS